MNSSRRIIIAVALMALFFFGVSLGCAQTVDEVISKMVAAVNSDLEGAKRNWGFSGTFEIEGMGEYEGRNFVSSFECVTDGVSFLNRSTFDATKTTERRFYDQVNALFTPKALYVTRYSARIKPLGCETRIHNANSSRIRDSTEASMRWIPSQLGIAEFDPRMAFTSKAIETTLPSGEIRLRLDAKAGKSEMRYIVGVEPRFGYRIVSIEVTADGKPCQSMRVDWQEKDSLWFVKLIVTEDSFFGERVRLVVNEIDLKPTITDATFSMESLEMLPNSRVFDVRKPGATQEGKAPGAGETQPQRAGDLPLRPIR